MPAPGDTSEMTASLYLNAQVEKEQSGIDQQKQKHKVWKLNNPVHWDPSNNRAAHKVGQEDILGQVKDVTRKKQAGITKLLFFESGQVHPILG